MGTATPHFEGIPLVPSCPKSAATRKWWEGTLIESKWSTWISFQHSWLVMIRAAAALPVYSLFDFNMFKVLSQWYLLWWYSNDESRPCVWERTQWHRQQPTTYINLHQCIVHQSIVHQSTSIYINLHQFAQCCNASLSCCKLHSWNIWSPRLLATNTWKPTQRSKILRHALSGPMGAVHSTTGEPT